MNNLINQINNLNTYSKIKLVYAHKLIIFYILKFKKLKDKTKQKIIKKICENIFFIINIYEINNNFNNICII